MTRAHDKALGSWDALFSVLPAQPISKNARTLMGFFTPPVPDKGGRVVFRDGKNTRYLSYADFTWSVGKPFLLTLSWGKLLRLYVDGKKIAELNERCSLPEELVPSFFTVDNADRFTTEAVRLSSTERMAASLWKDASHDFSTDADTTLLATDGLTRITAFTTAWSSGYHMMKPLFQERFSVLDTADEPVYPLIGVNATKTAKNVELRITTTDRAGISSDTSSVITLPAESPAAQYSIPLPALKKSGYYTVRMEITVDAVTSKYQSAIAVFPAKTSAGKLSHWLGQHFEERFDLAVYDKAALLTLRADPFGWPRVEPHKGVWDWSLADEFVAAAEKRNIEVLGILGWTPRWAGVEPADPAAIQNNKGSVSWKPRSVEEFGTYVFQTVARFKGRVAYWEVWNEVDWHPPAPAFSFTGSTEEYLALLKEAYIQAKRADPSCKVLISGFGLFGDKNMPKDLMAKGAGDYFDIFNFHAYAGAMAYQPLKELIAEKKPGAPSWNSEHMWHEMEGEAKRDYLSVASLLWFMEKDVMIKKCVAINVRMKVSYVHGSIEHYEGWATPWDAKSKPVGKISQPSPDNILGTVNAVSPNRRMDSLPCALRYLPKIMFKE